MRRWIFGVLLAVGLGGLALNLARLEPASAEPDYGRPEFAPVTATLGEPPEDFELPADTSVTGATVFGPDDRVQIMNTMDAPWRSIVEIVIFDQWDNIVGTCSGVMVADDAVLTAAHCLWDDWLGTFYDSFLIIPGASGLYWPFGTALGLQASIPVGYTTTNDIFFDFGLLHIAYSEYGSATQPYFTIASVPDSYFYHWDTVIATAGYPGDKPPGTMWFSADFGFWVDENAIYTQMDAYPGQSGSPIYTANETFNEVFTVGVYSQQHAGANFAVRFTPLHIMALNNYCSDMGCYLSTLVRSDAPPTPVPTATFTPTATPTQVPVSTPTASPTASPTPVGGGTPIPTPTPLPNGSYQAIAPGIQRSP